MLLTSSSEPLGARVPGAIVDDVGVTLLLEDAVSAVVIAVNLMLVVEIGSADPAISIHGAGLDTTGTLCNLDALSLLTSAGIPGEDGGLRADLTGDGGGACGVQTEAHNVICVMVLVIGHVLGGRLNLTTTEEFLGVAILVQDNTKGGSHVDSLALTVPVSVLLGFGAAVAIDVLKSVGLVGL